MTLDEYIPGGKKTIALPIPAWIVKILPDYDPAHDWIGTCTETGHFLLPLPSQCKVGDILADSSGSDYIVRYLDIDTLVTRKV